MLCHVIIHVAGASLSPPAPVAIARPTPGATDAPASPSAVAACEGLLPTPEIRRTVCGARGPRAVLAAVEAGGLNAHDAHTVGSWMITAWDPRTAISAVLRSPAKHSSNYTCALVHGGLWHAIALLGALPETWLALCGDDLEPYQLFECAQGLGKASFLRAVHGVHKVQPALRPDPKRSLHASPAAMRDAEEACGAALPTRDLAAVCGMGIYHMYRFALRRSSGGTYPEFDVCVGRRFVGSCVFKALGSQSTNGALDLAGLCADAKFWPTQRDRAGCAYGVAAKLAMKGIGDLYSSTCSKLNDDVLTTGCYAGALYPSTKVASEALLWRNAGPEAAPGVVERVRAQCFAACMKLKDGARQACEASPPCTPPAAWDVRMPFMLADFMAAAEERHANLTSPGSAAANAASHVAAPLKSLDPAIHLRSAHVLVTGGVGFIGSHAALALLELGSRITVLDNLSRGNMGAYRVLEGEATRKQIQFWNVDLGNKEALCRKLKRSSVNVVMHFAAIAYVSESISDPLKYFANITSSTVNLLECMRQAGVSNLVYSSTCAIYGNPETLPITESTTLRPINPYGKAKFMSEEIIRDFAAQNSYFKSGILRYFNVYGSDPRGRLGEYPRRELARYGRITGACMDVALGLVPRLTVLGTRHPTKDGTCVRDFIHVTDLVSAHIMLMPKLANPPVLFNVGTGRGVSVLEFVAACKNATGQNIAVKVQKEPRPGDAAEVWADPTAIETFLGWQAKYTDVAEGLTHMWNWRRDHPHGYERT